MRHRATLWDGFVASNVGFLSAVEAGGADWACQLRNMGGLMSTIAQLDEPIVEGATASFWTRILVYDDSSAV